MSGDAEVDTSRTRVQTYVPAYQRDVWDEHADRLNMSRSEFVKTMVQAGRQQIGDDPDLIPDESADDADEESEESLASEVIALLEENGTLSWDELVTVLTDDIESRLDEALQESDQIRHSGRAGGYVLVEGSNE